MNVGNFPDIPPCCDIRERQARLMKEAVLRGAEACTKIDEFLDLIRDVCADYFSDNRYISEGESVHNMNLILQPKVLDFLLT